MTYKKIIRPHRKINAEHHKNNSVVDKNNKRYFDQNGPPYAIHFNRFPHDLSHFNFIVIEKIMNTDGDLDNTLLKREGYWAAQLRTLQPFGLNKRCEFRSKNGSISMFHKKLFCFHYSPI